MALACRIWIVAVACVSVAVAASQDSAVPITYTETVATMPASLAVSGTVVVTADRMLVPTRDKILIISKNGGTKSAPAGPGAWIMSAEENSIIAVAADGTRLFNRDGRLRKEWLGATPVGGVEGRRVLGLRRRQGGNVRVSLVGKDLSEYGGVALPGTAGNSLAILAEDPLTILSWSSGSRPWAPTISAKLWRGGKLVRDLVKDYPSSRILRTSPSGRVYLVQGGAPDDKASCICLDAAGHEVWKSERAHVRMQVYPVGKKGSNAVLVGYEDPAFDDVPGKLRLLLLGSDGQEIADFSDFSFNRPALSVDRRHALMVGKDSVQSVALPGGRVLWRMPTKEFAGGEEVNRLAVGKMSQAGPRPVYVMSFRERKRTTQPSVTTILAVDVLSGRTVCKKKLDGDWTVKVASNRAIWACGKDGRMRHIEMRERR